MKTVVAILLCVVIAAPSFAAEFRFSPRPNKAHRIQWRTWSEQSLAEARKKDRLILLSLSAVWCHWCHVMDETTYSDNAVIAFLNEQVIPIRVDADIRPDIDSMYNQGGWPSTAILTPDGEVISGGNYFQPEELLSRLKRAVALYRDDRATLEQRLAERKAANQPGGIEGNEFKTSPGEEDLRGAMRVLKDGFDPKYGGFGTGQKFPNPEAVDFLLSRYAGSGDRSIRDILVTTLDHMAEGGLHDKIEGGFFRYATKRDWSEPHYEKLLSVNAGMIRNYADAGHAFGEKEFIAVMESTIRYVLANLYDPETGAFYGSQDADEEYYRKARRQGMKPPFIDRTVYSDSASLMISALTSAYEATGREAYLAAAMRSADYLLTTILSDTQGVLHSRRDGLSSLPGMLVDNALFGTALLDLYTESGERRYLNTASALGRRMVDRFYDPSAGRLRMISDLAAEGPAAGSVLGALNANAANFRAVAFLARLSYLNRDKALREVCKATMTTLSAEYRKFSPHAGLYGSALQWIAEEPLEITVVAGRGGAVKYLAAINGVYAPRKVVRVLELRGDAGEIAQRGYSLREAAVYLCAGKRCSKPIHDPGKVKGELKRFITMRTS